MYLVRLMEWIPKNKPPVAEDEKEPEPEKEKPTEGNASQAKDDTAKDEDLARQLSLELNPFSSGSSYWAANSNGPAEDMEGEFGERFEFWVKWNVTLAELRRLIHERLPHLPPENQRLIKKDLIWGTSQAPLDGLFHDFFMAYRGETIYVEPGSDRTKPSAVADYFHKISNASNSTTDLAWTFNPIATTTDTGASTGWAFTPPKEKGVTIKKKSSKKVKKEEKPADAGSEDAAGKARKEEQEDGTPDGHAA